MCVPVVLFAKLFNILETSVLVYVNHSEILLVRWWWNVTW